MRADAIGLFWQDEPAKRREPKVVVKRQPPAPTWLEDSYLPGLNEALTANYNLMNDDELFMASLAQETLIVDVECYYNYFLVGFLSFNTGKRYYLEFRENEILDAIKLNWIMENFITIGFNSFNYDIPMIQLAANGLSTKFLKHESDEIIVNECKPSDILKKYKIKKNYKYRHIDLVEVAPLSASLKIYAGRIHAPSLQDLPFHPSKILNEKQISIVRHYNLKKDLVSTAYLRAKLEPELELRALLSTEYKLDLMSKSDAQIAEALIANELKRMTMVWPKKPTIEPGTIHCYQPPHYLKYSTEIMKWTLNFIKSLKFEVQYDGKVYAPPTLEGLKIQLGNTVYKIGIGGLHSTEKSIAHFADDNYKLFDIDAESFYPWIILNLGLFPKHLGRQVVEIYRSFVLRRLKAKHEGNKKVSDSLKITINGFFGKLGSAYSLFYSPELLIQVTITGQLLLLMLAERFELAGIPVISGNTDGIVVKCHKDQIKLKDQIVKQWEIDCDFKTETNEYSALINRDVNCYIAVKAPTQKSPKATIKTKGNLFNRSGLSKNPTGEICIDAIESFLCDNVPIEETVRACTDIRKFIHVRKVDGGAVRLGSDCNEFLGKAIRWYYSTASDGELVYAKNGNRVPQSAGAKPIMDLPDSFPGDVDYEHYIATAKKMLKVGGLLVA